MEIFLEMIVSLVINVHVQPYTSSFDTYVSVRRLGL